MDFETARGDQPSIEIVLLFIILLIPRNIMVADAMQLKA
jgi:hypothetical protein